MRRFIPAILLFCLSLAVSVLFSLHRQNSTAELYKYISALLLFFIAAGFTQRERLVFINTMVIYGVILSILAIYQYFFGYLNLLQYVKSHGINAPYIIETLNQNRAYFPFVSPNMLGGYVGMLIPLTLINGKRRWAIIPLLLTLLLTRSFGAITSTFLGICIYTLLQAKVRKMIAAILSGLLLILGIVIIMRTTTAKEHIQPIFSTLARLDYWKATLPIISLAPLTGVGIGNFNLAQTRFAHNSYLQIWAEMGLPGLISLVWLISLSGKQAMNNIRLNREDSPATIALLSSVSVFLIHNIIDFTFFLPEVALLWWMLLGMSINDGNDHSHTDL
ncbi:MAG: O-antigen ligase family protein [Candidatus Omnitrophota bacterium]